MRDTMLLPAFADPVDDAQKTFRLALAALSEPGTMHDAGPAPALHGLAPATYALCLALLDAETPLWLSPALDTPAVRANLAFHCACPLAGEVRRADFALLTPDDLDALPDLPRGTDRDPHLSCTVLVQMESLDGGPDIRWQGPGIAGSRTMRLPLPPVFWQTRAAEVFPRGLDFFFAAGRAITALPRSTRVSRPITKET